MAVSTKAFEWIAVGGACLVYYLNFFLERWRHSQNSKMLRFVGFELEQSFWYTLYYLLIGIGPILLVSTAITASSGPTERTILTALPLLFVAQLLRGGAISALGNGWIMGFVWNDEWQLVERGPYRWLRHPEYIARWMDMLGFAVLIGLGTQASLLVMIILSVVTIRISRWETSKMKMDVIAKGLSNPLR
jgi:isoprenylcysteine carboxyl methyltransferase (ICMT) family protein YpbQ